VEINTIFKEQLLGLIRAGRRAEAITILQQKLDISQADAKRLIAALEAEQHGQPTTAQSAGAATLTGCLSLIFKMLAGLLLLVCIVFTLLAGYFWQQSYSFARQALKIKGEVINLTPQPTDSTYLAPLIAYQVNSQTYQHQHNHYSQEPSYHLQQEVNLLVNPEQPDQAKIDSFEGLYFEATGLAILAAISLFFAWLLNAIARKIKKIVAG
jgi:hypothetical protein